jgi:hypothetical protein
MAREIERNLSAYLIAAAHVQSDHPVAPKTAALLDRDPICNQALHHAGFVGVARETERTKNAKGFGAILHGKIAINGHCYDFVSGGRRRGSIPPGRYRVGKAENHPYLHGKAFALSDVFDPLAKDVRSALFMHVGLLSSGCVAIAPGQFKAFVADMTAVGPTSFDLVLSGPLSA